MNLNAYSLNPNGHETNNTIYGHAINVSGDGNTIIIGDTPPKKEPIMITQEDYNNGYIEQCTVLENGEYCKESCTICESHGAIYSKSGWWITAPLPIKLITLVIALPLIPLGSMTVGTDELLGSVEEIKKLGSKEKIKKLGSKEKIKKESESKSKEITPYQMEVLTSRKKEEEVKRIEQRKRDEVMHKLDESQNVVDSTVLLFNQYAEIIPKAENSIYSLMS
jgi:hypothetical protein